MAVNAIGGSIRTFFCLVSLWLGMPKDSIASSDGTPFILLEKMHFV